MNEQEIRTWAYDQARMKCAQCSAQPQNIEEDAIRIARFVTTGRFDEVPAVEDMSPKS